MKKRFSVRGRFIVLGIFSFVVVLLGIGLGSVRVSPTEIIGILANRLWGRALPRGVPESYVYMVMDMRLPRVLLAFFTGGALAMCGAVMQSVLRNPLASPFGLGVSAGAGLGAATVIVFGLSFGALGTALLPAMSLVFAVGTVVLSLTIASRLDKSFSNVTIVLVGMVLSLFFDAIMNLMASTSPTSAERIRMWQFGSFSMKEWSAVLVSAPMTVLFFLLFFADAGTLDAMSFGEQQAAALGVDLRKSKWMLLAGTAVLTAVSVCFAGIIGFIDLVAPHVARRLFGASHRRMLPASALFGASFMVLCDLAARTLVSGREIPIGAITALIGAPFFFYVFFKRR